MIPSCSIQAPSDRPMVTEAPPAQPLPFKGRLIDGDPAELPPAVALSLSPTAPITFSYREELSHDEYHLPLWFTAIDPVTYAGSPLGDYGVSAFASLSIIGCDQTLGDYTARAHVTKSYNLYTQPTHQELERAARAKVRGMIDEKLARDEVRLAGAARDSCAAANGAVLR
jgi:hypothetical protein